MDLFNQLRNKYKTFIYHDFHIEDGGFSFHFSMDDYHFRPSWKFDKTLLNSDYNRDLLEYMVFSLGMAELVSYWKAACPKVVEVRCGHLDDFAIDWWKRLYFGGLGEFFYNNDIITTPKEMMEIRPISRDIPKFPISSKAYKGNLIPIGGGKDSVVTLELLKDYHKENLCYIINPRGATVGCANVGGYLDSQIIGVNRTIDSQLLELNKLGFLNGHTPISSVIAFSSVIFAYLTGRKYVVLSNESSANEGNIAGSEVNHQYSKSTQFERDFREYTSRYFGENPSYFSLLRPWSEWQIAKEFVKHEKYFPVFQSCNVGSKTDTWCGKCAKCLYVYILLSGFLSDEKLTEIIGDNMLNNPLFTDLFNSLVYDSYDKPFECVGTREEINLALQKAYELRKSSGNIPILLEGYINSNPNYNINLDDYFDLINFVPQEYINLLKDNG